MWVYARQDGGIFLIVGVCRIGYWNRRDPGTYLLTPTWGWGGGVGPLGSGQKSPVPWVLGLGAGSGGLGTGPKGPEGYAAPRSGEIFEKMSFKSENFLQNL